MFYLCILSLLACIFNLSLILILVSVGFICAHDLMLFLGVISVSCKITSMLPLLLFSEVSVRAPHCGGQKSYSYLVNYGPENRSRIKCTSLVSVLELSF